MSEEARPQPGMIVWTDLTVTNAEELRDFYSEVVGWEASPVDMGDYSDFSMNAPDSGTPISGVCHARGPNENLPPQWLIYVTVRSLDTSIAKCNERGGEIIAGPKSMGSHGRYCVIRDPAGAVMALIQPAD
jgi:predicted enzyme related to lactoylglutathione lyase